MFEYNTTREKLILREYGRNVQNLVKYIKNLEEKEERTNKAQLAIKIMKSINPKVRSLTDDSRKIWDDLFIISDYQLDITSPYPPPEKDVMTRKVSKLPYKQGAIKYKHYGRNVELLINQAVQEESVEKQEKIIAVVIRIMRGFNTALNTSAADIDYIVDAIKEISNQKLKIDFEAIKEDMSSQKGNNRAKYKTNRITKKG